MDKSILLEYIWIDAFENLRSKIKIVEKIENFNLEKIQEWNFDGSSTGQAEGTNSDILLKPKSLYNNPFFDYIESYFFIDAL